jgi:hypothetical protein
MTVRFERSLTIRAAPIRVTENRAQTERRSPLGPALIATATKPRPNKISAEPCTPSSAAVVQATVAETEAWTAATAMQATAIWQCRPRSGDDLPDRRTCGQASRSGIWNWISPSRQPSAAAESRHAGRVSVGASLPHRNAAASVDSPGKPLSSVVGRYRRAAVPARQCNDRRRSTAASSDREDKGQGPFRLRAGMGAAAGHRNRGTAPARDLSACRLRSR